MMARLPLYSFDKIILMCKIPASMFLDWITRYPPDSMNPVASGGGTTYGVEVSTESLVSAKENDY